MFALLVQSKQQLTILMTTHTGNIWGTITLVTTATASAPDTPGRPSLTSRTANSLTFSVAAVTEATRYQWRISNNSTITDSDTIVTTTSPSYTIRNLSANTQRWVDVRAENAVGNSAYSLDGTGTTTTTQTSNRQRTFYRRGTSRPSRPTSNSFGAYNGISGWSTSNPGATATQGVYAVTLTQSFNSQTQNSSTHTGNSWSSVTRIASPVGRPVTDIPTNIVTLLGTNAIIFVESPRNVAIGTEPWATQYSCEFEYDTTGFTRNNRIDTTSGYETLFDTYDWDGTILNEEWDSGDTVRARTRFIRKSDNTKGPWTPWSVRLTRP